MEFFFIEKQETCFYYFKKYFGTIMAKEEKKAKLKKTLKGHKIT